MVEANGRIADEWLGASVAAAVASAAANVLLALVPSQVHVINQQLSVALAAIPNGPAKSAGIALGRQAAQLILDRRADDGADTPGPPLPSNPANPNDPYVSTNLPGDYRFDTTPNFGFALYPSWGLVTPFVIGSASTTWCRMRLRKSLKVLDQKLRWLAADSEFDVTVNSVVGGGIRNPGDALTVVQRARELGFSTTVGIIHDGRRTSSLQWETFDCEGWLATRSSRSRGKRERRMVDQNSASWNRLFTWLRHLDELRAAAQSGSDRLQTLCNLHFSRV